MELQIGDVIEQYNSTGSSNRETTKTYNIIVVTKTLAKSDYRRFKRQTEMICGVECVNCVDDGRWSVNGYRLQKK